MLSINYDELWTIQYRCTINFRKINQDSLLGISTGFKKKVELFMLLKWSKKKKKVIDLVNFIKVSSFIVTVYISMLIIPASLFDNISTYIYNKI